MFSMIDIESRTKTHRYTAAVRYFPDKNGSIFSFPYISLKERSHGPMGESLVPLDQLVPKKHNGPITKRLVP
uniref:Uncharacterized protein n=1 Tax=Caenorhabditis brenneri TaxID=135651 RepID=B6VBJ9_CAEBE|nr:hypothetical protein Cbre_JD11.016 [Caenorhabditis brenneri]